MIAAYKVSGDERYFESAKKSFNFIRDNMWKKNKLYACYHDKEYFNAYLDDYAFLAKSCIELLKIEWRDSNFDFLIKLTDILMNDFQDHDNGGFYFTSLNHEELIYRPKSYMDESLPSGNSVVVDVLSELYELLGESRYIDAVENTIRSAHDSLDRSTFSHCSLLLAAPKTMNSKRLIIIRCKQDNLKDIQNKINKVSKLNDNVYFIPNEIEVDKKSLSDKVTKGEFTAYICQNNICSQPISSLDEFTDFIKK